MIGVQSLDALRADGKLRWVGREFGWAAEPEIVVDALSREGFHEYRREIARSRRRDSSAGGVWQGLNDAGSVASAIWVNRPEAGEAIVFIDIDGEPLRAS